MFMKFNSKSFRGTRDSNGNTESSASEDGTNEHVQTLGAAKVSPISMRSILNDTPQNDTSPLSSERDHAQKMSLSSVLDDPNDGSYQGMSQGRSSAKSKTGCLTCKFRKKKCDETKPVCRDCRRFHKECVWVDHRTMNGAEIERLRTRVREQESSKKMRKRASLPRSALAKLSSFSPIPASPEFALDPDGVLTTQNGSMDNTHNTQSMYSSHPLSDIRASPAISYSPSSTETCVMPKKSVKAEPASDSRPLSSTHSDGVPLEDPYSDFSAISIPTISQIPPAHMSSSGSAAEMHDYTQSQDVLSPFEHLAEPRSPGAVLNFLKELSSFNWNSQEHAQIQGVTEDINEAVSPKLDRGVSPDRISSSFNIPTFIEQMQTISHDFPAQFNNLASSFNATFSPSPRASLSVLPELDQSGFHLYNYYSDVLSSKISIAPNSQNDSNSYQRVFLPLAQKDKGVLYGILAWAGFHLGGHWMAEGSKYAELALKHLCDDISFNEGSQTIEDRRAIINKLAIILILCGAEICRGDVKRWSVYLKWGWKLLKDNGGIMNFNNNKEEHWLISNFAYHDLLASSTSNRGTYFPNETYDKIFLDADGISSGNLNPLLGVSKPLYKVIGDISSLFFESKQIMSEYYSRMPGAPKVSEVSLESPEEGSVRSFPDTPSETSDHSRLADLLNFISNKAHTLEVTLNDVKPHAGDLEGLSDSELELQLTTFEAFQLSCKLYLRQAILKFNPSALECQILMNDLVKCLDILIDSPMQATLVFPLFIAGIFTVTESGKAAMRSRFELLITIYGPWNVVRVKSLVEKIWDENPHGDRVVDWNAILNNLNWDLNFA